MTTSLRERLLAAANQADNECRDSAERAGFEIVLFTGSKIGALLREAAAALTAPASPPALEDDTEGFRTAWQTTVQTLHEVLPPNWFCDAPEGSSGAERVQHAIRKLAASPVAVQPEGGDYVDADDVFLSQGTDDVPCLQVPGRILARFIPGSWARAYELFSGNTRPVAVQQAVTDGDAALLRWLRDVRPGIDQEFAAVVHHGYRNADGTRAQPPEAATQEGQ